jgi:hypothetical protein
MLPIDNYLVHKKLPRCEISGIATHKTKQPGRRIELVPQLEHCSMSTLRLRRDILLRLRPVHKRFIEGASEFLEWDEMYSFFTFTPSYCPKMTDSITQDNFAAKYANEGFLMEAIKMPPEIILPSLTQLKESRTATKHEESQIRRRLFCSSCPINGNI